MDDPLSHVVPVLKVLLRNVAHHLTQEGADITLRLGVQDREYQAALLVAGKGHEIPITPAVLAKFHHIGYTPKLAIGTIGPGVVRAAKGFFIAAGARLQGHAPVGTDIHQHLGRTVCLPADQQGGSQHIQGFEIT